MIDVLALSLALTLSAAPADLGPVPAVEAPAPVQCADATLAKINGPIFASLGDPIPPATCSEDCNGLPNISCSGSVCTAVQRNCDIGERGYVTCDGNTTFCAEDCSGGGSTECDDGEFDIVRTGQCCDCSTGGEVREFYQCVDGQWVLQSSSCGPSGSCPICP